MADQKEATNAFAQSSIGGGGDRCAGGGLLSNPAAPQVTKIGVCHGTGSDSNPYTFIEVDDNPTQLEAHREHQANPPGTISRTSSRVTPAPADITSEEDCDLLEPPPTTAPPEEPTPTHRARGPGRVPGCGAAERASPADPRGLRAGLRELLDG